MGTYETALTHAFDKAQTKTIHTPTEDSYAWVLSMADPFAFVSRHRVIRLTPFLGLIDNKGYVEAHPSAHAFQTYTTLSHQTAIGRGMRPDAGERAVI
jgi:hypothetical protein